MGLYAKSLALLAVAVAQTFGAIYDQVSQLPTHTYDYVIVGGTSHDCLRHDLRRGTNSDDS